PRRRSARRVEKNQTLRLGGPYRQGRRATEPQKRRLTQRRTFRRARQLRQRRSVRTCAEDGASKGKLRKPCIYHPRLRRRWPPTARAIPPSAPGIDKVKARLAMPISQPPESPGVPQRGSSR